MIRIYVYDIPSYFTFSENNLYNPSNFFYTLENCKSTLSFGFLRSKNLGILEERGKGEGGNG
jgi:hypothetical protein